LTLFSEAEFGGKLLTKWLFAVTPYYAIQQMNDDTFGERLQNTIAPTCVGAIVAFTRN